MIFILLFAKNIISGKNMARHYEIDNTDLIILNLLMEDATMPYTAIAKEAGVSAGTVHVRMAKLEKIGAVKGSTLIVEPSVLGYDVCAFMGVYLQKGSLFREVLQFRLENILKLFQVLIIILRFLD